MNKDITLEDLGYRDIDGCNSYEKPDEEEKWLTKCIYFYPSDKTIMICKEDKCENREYLFYLTTQEMQAIYNKCKDWGWVDE